MALKHKINSAAYAKLDKIIQDEYKKDGEDFVLDVDGLEDTGTLVRAKEHEVNRRKTAEQKVKDAEQKALDIQAELEELREAKAKGGDAVSAAEKKAAEKLAKREKELTDANAALQKALEEQMVTTVAGNLASELAGENSELLLPHLSKRLVAVYKDGKVTTAVLGADGQPSAVTLDELKKEVLSSPKFATVVVASKGSGSGGTGPRKGAGGSGAAKKLSEMTATEEATFARESPVEYQKMIAAEPVGFQPPATRAKV